MSIAGPPQAIIFDLDGTLVDTESLAQRAWEATEAHFGWSAPEGFYGQLIGVTAKRSVEMMHAIFPPHIDVDSFRDISKKHYRRLITTMPVRKPGTKALLKRCEELGIRRCVASSSQREHGIVKLARAEITDYFEFDLYGDEVEHGKPAPDLFLGAQERLGLPKEDIWIIEDSPNGLKAAAAAGIRAILVPDMAPMTDADKLLAWQIAPDLATVQGWLD